MAVIPFYDKIIVLEPFNILQVVSCPLQGRKCLWLSLELHLERVNMVFVHMRVAKLDDKLVRVGARDVSDHVREEGVGSDVERDAQPEVGGALVHQTREFGFGGWSRGGREVHVELA